MFLFSYFILVTFVFYIWWLQRCAHFLHEETRTETQKQRKKMNLDPFIGVWLPAAAKCLFQNVKPNFVNLLVKDDDKYQIILGLTKDFEEREFEQFYVLQIPEIVQEAKEEEPKEELEEPEKKD